jgi:predicted amidohydrolase YtcJ
LGYNYDHNFLPDNEHPVKKYLNQVSKTVPIYVLHASVHMGCVNDAALAMAGITADTPDPEGGKIGRENGSREPNGYLEENGMKALLAVFMPKVKFNLKESMEMAQNLYLQNGITTVQDGAATEQTVEMIRSFAAQGLLNIDVIAYLLVDQGGQEVFLKHSDCDNQYVNHYKLAGYKLVLDGSPQGKSAWLNKPYENSDGYCAYSWYTDEEVAGHMKTVFDDHRQILVHCNGDAAGDQFLKTYK